MNSANESFRISIGGYAESNRSPDIRMNSTFSWMHLSMIAWKDLKFSFRSSSCLQLPRWQSARCANFSMVVSLFSYFEKFWNVFKDSCGLTDVWILEFW